jgi:hypothetical protein
MAELNTFFPQEIIVDMKGMAINERGTKPRTGFSGLKRSSKTKASLSVKYRFFTPGHYS